MDGGQLNICRQAGTESVNIDSTDICLFRFQEQLVTVAIAKTVDFVLDTRAVARTLAVNTAAEHGAILETATQNVVGFQVRARNPAHAVIADEFVRNISQK